MSSYTFPIPCTCGQVHKMRAGELYTALVRLVLGDGQSVTPFGILNHCVVDNTVPVDYKTAMEYQSVGMGERDSVSSTASA